MEPGNTILAQTDIDSLLAAHVEEPWPPSVVRVARVGSLAQSPQAETREESPAPAMVPLHITMARLEERLEAVETSVSKAAQPQGMGPETSAAIDELRQGFQIVVEYVQRLNSRVEDILKNLQATPGYALHKGFTCQSCNESGSVAITVTCTRCQHKSLRGWWPQRQ